MRPPCVVRWPDRIPVGSEYAGITSVMDILPTFAAFAGVDLPTDRVIDGYDISGMLCGEVNAASPYDTVGFFYYQMSQLQAVRSGRVQIVSAPVRKNHRN